MALLREVYHYLVLAFMGLKKNPIRLDDEIFQKRELLYPLLESYFNTLPTIHTYLEEPCLDEEEFSNWLLYESNFDPSRYSHLDGYDLREEVGKQYEQYASTPRYRYSVDPNQKAINDKIKKALDDRFKELNIGIEYIYYGPYLYGTLFNSRYDTTIILIRQRINCIQKCKTCPHGPYWRAFWRDSGKIIFNNISRLHETNDNWKEMEYKPLNDLLFREPYFWEEKKIICESLAYERAYSIKIKHAYSLW